MKYKTKFYVTDKPRFLNMLNVVCTEEDLASSASGTPIAFSEVVFEFASSSGEIPDKGSPPHKRLSLLIHLQLLRVLCRIWGLLDSSYGCNT